MDDSALSTNGAELGFNPDALQHAFDTVESFVDRRIIPGGVACVGTSRGFVDPRPFGVTGWDESDSRVDPDTIYDCASVTKVVVTTTLALQLLDRGLVRLDDPVSDFIPEFASLDLGLADPVLDMRRQVTVRHLLTHTSGLPAWIDVNRDGTGYTNAVHNICRTSFQYEPGQKVAYSCLGFILLGQIVQQVTSTPLDDLAGQRIFKPLQMHDSGFNPAEALHARVAPTEKVAGVTIHGVVHDENARGMGGVSGNAGLFSTAHDLARFLMMLLNQGTLEEARVLSAAVLALATRNHTAHLNLSRGLGWVVRGFDTHSAGGDLFSPQSFGHTGFTGTSLWIDPASDTFAVLLTNRVHPSRANQSHLQLRGLFHNAVAASRS